MSVVCLCIIFRSSNICAHARRDENEWLSSVNNGGRWRWSQFGGVCWSTDNRRGEKAFWEGERERNEKRGDNGGGWGEGQRNEDDTTRTTITRRTTWLWNVLSPRGKAPIVRPPTPLTGWLGKGRGGGDQPTEAEEAMLVKELQRLPRWTALPNVLSLKYQF